MPFAPVAGTERTWMRSWSTPRTFMGSQTSRQYTVVPGEATFVDEQTVRVGDAVELSAERILIATGGRTAVPPIPGIEQVDWIDHISALELDRVPESLLVIGAGPVGLEFAQIFARLGSRVAIVNHGTQIAARADTEAANELQAALEEEGIEVIRDLLAHSPNLHRQPISAAEVHGCSEWLTADGDLRTLPCHLSDPDSRMGGLDGF